MILLSITLILSPILSGINGLPMPQFSNDEGGDMQAFPNLGDAGAEADAESPQFEVKRDESDADISSSSIDDLADDASVIETRNVEPEVADAEAVDQERLKRNPDTDLELIPNVDVEAEAEVAGTQDNNDQKREDDETASDVTTDDDDEDNEGPDADTEASVIETRNVEPEVADAEALEQERLKRNPVPEPGSIPNIGSGAEAEAAVTLDNNVKKREDDETDGETASDVTTDDDVEEDVDGPEEENDSKQEETEAENESSTVLPEGENESTSTSTVGPEAGNTTLGEKVGDDKDKEVEPVTPEVETAKAEDKVDKDSKVSKNESTTSTTDKPLEGAKSDTEDVPLPETVKGNATQKESEPSKTVEDKDEKKDEKEEELKPENEPTKDLEPSNDEPNTSSTSTATPEKVTVADNGKGVTESGAITDKAVDAEETKAKSDVGSDKNEKDDVAETDDEKADADAEESTDGSGVKSVTPDVEVKDTTTETAKKSTTEGPLPSKTKSTTEAPEDADETKEDPEEEDDDESDSEEDDGDGDGEVDPQSEDIDDILTNSEENKRSDIGRLQAETPDGREEEDPLLGEEGKEETEEGDEEEEADADAAKPGLDVDDEKNTSTKRTANKSAAPAAFVEGDVIMKDQEPSLEKRNDEEASQISEDSLVDVDIVGASGIKRSPDLSNSEYANMIPGADAPHEEKKRESADSEKPEVRETRKSEPNKNSGDSGPIKKRRIIFGTAFTASRMRRKFPLVFCDLEMDVGIVCPGVKRGNFMDNFYYDPLTNRCQHFAYNGCGGNGNRFSSLWECNMSCVKKTVATIKIS